MKLDPFDLLRIGLLAAVYLIAGKLGLLLATTHGNVSLVWAPTGIALSTVLLWGYRVWPGLALGAFLVNVTTNVPFAAAVAMAAGNTLESIIGAWLLGRVGFDCQIQRLRDVLALVTLAALASTTISATVGVTALWLSGEVLSRGYARLWLYWWVGDAMGALLVAPFLLTWTTRPRLGWKRWQLVETAFLFAGLIVVGLFIFVRLPDYSRLAFLVFPFLIWAALRFGQRETVTLTLLATVLAVWGTMRGVAGPAQTFEERYVYVHIFLGVAGVTAMLLAAVLAEREVVRRELQSRNAELTRSNQELDDFAYVASHDLKEPLRGIHMYSNFLIEDYGAQLGDDGCSKLNTLKSLTERMNALIDSLLEFSRVGRVNLAVQEADLNVVVKEVCDSLRINLAESGVEMRIPQPLPKVPCDPVRVGEVFRNLITNAMKYNDKPSKWIEIGWQSTPHDGTRMETVLYVRDNGIGIRDKHQEIIFRIFKRLHGRNEFGGGAGVGLTIVKTIERHGGRIWLESKVGEGSTFYFTLG